VGIENFSGNGGKFNMRHWLKGIDALNATVGYSLNQ